MQHASSKFIAAALVALVAGTAGAQTAGRAGFYGSAGIGYGSASNSIDADGSTSASQSGLTITAGLGTGLGKQWRLGVQFDYLKGSTTKYGGSTDVTTTFYTAALAYYPSMTMPIWIRANLGYGNLSGTNSGQSASEGGFAGGLGVGYDWMPGKSDLAVIPFIAWQTQFSKGTFGGAFSGTGAKGSGSIFQIGASIGLRH